MLLQAGLRRKVDLSLPVLVAVHAPDHSHGDADSQQQHGPHNPWCTLTKTGHAGKWRRTLAQTAGLPQEGQYFTSPSSDRLGRQRKSRLWVHLYGVWILTPWQDCRLSKNGFSLNILNKYDLNFFFGTGYLTLIFCPPADWICRSQCSHVPAYKLTATGIPRMLNWTIRFVGKKSFQFLFYFEYFWGFLRIRVSETFFFLSHLSEYSARCYGLLQILVQVCNFLYARTGCWDPTYLLLVHPSFPVSAFRQLYKAKAVARQNTTMITYTAKGRGGAWPCVPVDKNALLKRRLTPLRRLRIKMVKIARCSPSHL